jgi:hypothetical protein
MLASGTKAQEHIDSLGNFNRDTREVVVVVDVANLRVSGATRLAQAKLPANKCTESVRDLSMPRYRSLLPVGRVAVDVVALAVPVEDAPGRF